MVKINSYVMGLGLPQAEVSFGGISAHHIFPMCNFAILVRRVTNEH